MIKIRLAKKEDDKRIIEILRNNPIEGKISLSYCREPSYFKSLVVEGKEHQTIVGEINNKIIGFGTKSIRTVFINGKPKDIGYLNGLRLEKEFRGKGLLKNGYLYFKELHKKENKVKLYYSTIIEDNWLAKKILESKKDYLPTYKNIGKINVYAVRLLEKKDIDSNVKIIKGNDQIISKIFDFINSEGSKKQFFPYYENINDLYNVKPEDFYVAFKDKEIVGVVLKWNQSDIKQTIVTGYNGLTNITKEIYNLNAKRKNYPLLPSIGKPFNHFYLSLITIKEDNINVFKQLLNKVYNDNVHTDFSYFIFGLSDKDKLTEALLEYKYVLYPSSLYCVYWEDGKGEYEKLDNRIPYVEVATLWN